MRYADGRDHSGHVEGCQVLWVQPTLAPNSQLLTPRDSPALVPPGWSSCLLARAVQWVGGREGWPDGLGGAVTGEVSPQCGALLGAVHSGHVMEGRADYTSGWGGGGHHYMVTIRMLSSDTTQCSLEPDTPLPGEPQI